MATTETKIVTVFLMEAREIRLTAKGGTFQGKINKRLIRNFSRRENLVWGSALSGANQDIIRETVALLSASQ